MPASPARVKKIDKAVFTVLDGLATLRTVALVGDLNLLWESTGKGFHGELRERWKNRRVNPSSSPEKCDVPSDEEVCQSCKMAIVRPNRTRESTSELGLGCGVNPKVLFARAPVLELSFCVFINNTDTAPKAAIRVAASTPPPSI